MTRLKECGHHASATNPKVLKVYENITRSVMATILVRLPMLYLIIEHFRGGDPLPVYRRFRDRGRMAPAGLAYIASWVSEDFSKCFQVMECESRSLLEEWMANWNDLVDFEVIPVKTSTEAVAILGPRL
jgi:Protein of unknown function (DUF3303)